MLKYLRTIFLIFYFLLIFDAIWGVNAFIGFFMH